MMKIVNFQHAKNRRFLCMKKAQIEIIGLAILIILIVLGTTFVIRVMMTREPVEHKKEFTQTETASNMLNAFLETTSNCNELSMTELLRDCGQDNNSICFGNTVSSCNYAKEAAREIFGKTLEEWNIAYEFNVFYEKENPLFVLGKSCSGDKKSKLFPIPTSLGALSVKLDICS